MGGTTVSSKPPIPDRAALRSPDARIPPASRVAYHQPFRVKPFSGLVVAFGFQVTMRVASRGESMREAPPRVE